MWQEKGYWTSSWIYSEEDQAKPDTQCYRNMLARGLAKCLSMASVINNICQTSNALLTFLGVCLLNIDAFYLLNIDAFSKCMQNLCTLPTKFNQYLEG